MPATLTTSWSHGSGVAAGLCAVIDGVSELKMFLKNPINHQWTVPSKPAQAMQQHHGAMATASWHNGSCSCLGASDNVSRTKMILVPHDDHV